MSAATSLMLALLGRGRGAGDAEQALEQALLSETDPLHWCAARLGLPESEIMRRAAAWANLAYFDRMPRLSGLLLEPHRLEALRDIRLYKVQIHNREVALAAPDFFGVLRLADYCNRRPEVVPNICLVPAPALRRHIVELSSAALLDGARQNLVRKWPYAAAQLDLTKPVRYLFVFALACLAGVIVLAPVLGQSWLAPLWIALVLLPTVLRLLALFVPPEPVRSLEASIDASDLPVYSILVPLRHEANMVDQLCASLARLEYPPEKLDVIFVIESRSSGTVRRVRRHLADSRFSMIVVPDAPPRTKPKALGYALPMCQGEFVVVFDAEDRPEPDQLLRIVAQFRAQPDVACIQARLVIDNGRQGMLPALFAGEYAGLFAVLLPALARWRLVMPLGGTSNHFRIDVLRALGGWDAFNVTEDADLGVRLSRRKVRCATSSARTYEAAPEHLLPWMGQRTRWMKGWMQTYVVHNRRPGWLLNDMGWRGAIMFQVVLLGMLLSPLLYASFAPLLVFMLLTGQLAWPGMQVWAIACMLVLVVGHGAAMATNLVGLNRTGQRGLIGWQVLLPLYWLLIAFATVRALREFALRPFHWFKTPHVRCKAPADAIPAGSGLGTTNLDLRSKATTDSTRKE